MDLRSNVMVAGITASCVLGLILSSPVNARGVPDEEVLPGFDDLEEQMQDGGRCTVTRESDENSIYLVPTDPENPEARFNLMVWAGAVGNTASQYFPVLEEVASHCILVAMPNENLNDNGVRMELAFEDAIERYEENYLIWNGERACFAGHSVGATFAFNVADRIGAGACVIAVQPETRYLQEIVSSEYRETDVITIWGSADTIAPASGNRGNIESYADVITQIEIAGANHFEITSGETGGVSGLMLRMAAIAEVSPDEEERHRFRRVFFGRPSDTRVGEAHSYFSDVRLSYTAARPSAIYEIPQ